MTDRDVKLDIMPASFEDWVPDPEKPRRVAMLMSGGVDSSVSAYLLKKDGWDVVGFTMKIPVACDSGPAGCGGADATAVCKELDIPHYFIDVKAAFEKLVIAPFRQAYAKGITPNPCADCNALMKLSLVWDTIKSHFDIDYLGTGHYVRVVNRCGQYRLAMGLDKGKDQSYFLSGIKAERLSRMLFPLGEYSKDQIRKLAGEINLSAADKPESMELCFAGAGDYRDALEEKSKQTGDLLDIDGNVIDTHKGVSNYTIGQRRGLGYASSCPLYVAKIDAVNNTVTLGKKEEVFTDVIAADRVNVLIPEELDESVEMFGKIRSTGSPRACRFVSFDDGVLTVKFDEPVFASTPGQKLVVYNGNEEVIAGATIF